MLARRVAQKQLAAQRLIGRQNQLRCISTPPPSSETPKGPTEPYHYEKPTVQPSWLTQKVKQTPWAFNLFLNLSSVLGYGSATQVAGRRALVMYEQFCSIKAEEDRAFWQDACDMPLTFQSWFTITNLHIWLLTVRLRALPPPYGTTYIQALIDHFFLDVEERIRAVLQPMSEGPPPPAFYSVSTDNKNEPSVPTQKTKRGRAPDRLVTQQMKVLKEQWAGLGMSFDLGLVNGDVELAGAVWRNLLGARGARGIPFASTTTTGSQNPAAGFRRSINPLGSSTSKSRIKLLESGLESEESKDDGSGVHDYPLDKVDKYVTYPELMVDIIGYVRRELKRLEAISDEDIIGRDRALGKEGEGLGVLKFGRVRR